MQGSSGGGDLKIRDCSTRFASKEVDLLFSDANLKVWSVHLGFRSDVVVFLTSSDPSSSLLSCLDSPSSLLTYSWATRYPRRLVSCRSSATPHCLLDVYLAVRVSSRGCEAEI
ncbi:hypothetical protein Sjap_018093 [Stephania japonica]|uniref:Uncharacterized protein n=1 Tax=Stephania japonica TaxID=461633 RepID=A0AAP0NK68_9MAGN